MGKIKKNKKNILITIVLIALIYLILCVVFSFMIPSNILVGKTNLSNSTYKNVENELNEIVENSKVEISDKSMGEKTFSFSDLGIEINPEYEKELKKVDNFFFWLNIKPIDMTNKLLVLDEDKISKNIDDFLNKTQKTKGPQNAYITYENSKYTIIPEVESKQVNSDELAKGIIDSIKGSEKNYKINTEKYYTKPEISSKDLEKNLAVLNETISKEFYINFGEDKEQLSKDEVANFINVHEDGTYTFEKSSFEEYVTTLTYKYDTVKYTDTQRTQKVYYSTDTGKEFEKQLKDNNKTTVSVDTVENKDTKKIEQKAKGKKDTYIEVNISSQHLWYYKDNKLVLDTPVVTGDHSKSFDTPIGQFSIYAMQLDQVLDGSTVGYDYLYPVDYWMPFNGGVGFHDTRERTEFEYGSDTYLEGGGSHGCINMPPSKAKQLFETAKVGTTVYVTA